MNVFVLNTKEDILKKSGKQSSIFSPTIEVNGAPKQPDYKLSSEYLPLCSEQTHSYRFGTTWGWVNDDRVVIFGCTIPLSADLFWSDSYSVIFAAQFLMTLKSRFLLVNQKTYSVTAVQFLVTLISWLNINEISVQWSVQFESWWLLWADSFQWIKNTQCNRYSLILDDSYELIHFSESQNSPTPKTSESYNLKKDEKLHYQRKNPIRLNRNSNWIKLEGCKSEWNQEKCFWLN